jgi:hypothetical protein
MISELGYGHGKGPGRDFRCSPDAQRAEGGRFGIGRRLNRDDERHRPGGESRLWGILEGSCVALCSGGKERTSTQNRKKVYSTLFHSYTMTFLDAYMGQNSP